jgi:hypothetical protein
MKMILAMTLFISVLISQDLLTTKSNKEWEGEVINEEKYYIFFRVKGNDFENKIPKWTIKDIKRSDGSVLAFPDITEVPFELMTPEQQELIVQKREEERLLREQKREEERLLREQREKNSLFQFMVIPIKDDYYGLTEEVEASLDSMGYTVRDNIEALTYLDEKKICGDDINDLHLTSIGKKFELNFINYGYSYIVEEPFKYSPNIAATEEARIRVENSRDASSGMEVLAAALAKDAKALAVVAAKEEAKLEKAANEAGTYLGLTLFQIDIISGEKKILINNPHYRKLYPSKK